MRSEIAPMFMPPGLVIAFLLVALLIAVAYVGFVALGVAGFLAFTAFAATHLLRDPELRQRALHQGIVASWSAATVLAWIYREGLANRDVLTWKVVVPSAVISALPSLATWLSTPKR